MEENNYRILVVDDEPDLCEILRFNLEANGFQVVTANSAEEALEMDLAGFDLLLLDVMMGGMDGFAMARKVKSAPETHAVPIIFLTAKDTERDMLTGFSAGGDDYMAKPFSLHELLARVKAVVRRTQGEPERALLQAGSLTIDFEKKLVLAAGEALKLSPKEFGILSLLARHPGRVFSREEILAEVWHGETYVLDRTVDVHIARIRRKLSTEAVRLTNRQGYGYCFEENA